MRVLSFLRPSLLGLDIQPDAMRLVQIAKARSGFQIWRAGSRPLPAGAIVDGRIAMFEEIGVLLAELVTSLGVNEQVAAVSLSEKQVHRRTIELPTGLSEVEIEAEIQIQIQRELPGLKDRLVVDFSVHAVSGNHQQIYFAAVRESYLSLVTACINKAGLRLRIVDIDTAARERALRCYPDIQSWLSLASHVDDPVFQAHPQLFITACGTAMRDAPRW